jgi:serine/threonine protein kinase
VMELVEGTPLVDGGNVPMPLKRAIDILAQCADALDHIHKRGIVHGDVKAENIMMVTETMGSRRRQLVRLLDFGLARRPAVHAELEGSVSGSPHYIAPERAAGAAPSVSADIYALGVLGYLLLTGTLPFDGTVIEILTAHVHELPPTMSSRRTEPLDQAIEAMIGRALHKDPAQRHQSAAAFRYELNTVMDMLDMGRKRTRGSGVIKAESSRDSLLQVAFERSLLPQALISLEGAIVIANAAFAQLLGLAQGSAEGMMVSDTPLAQFVPGLMRALRWTGADSKPTERRAQVFRGEDAPPLELTIWLTPLSVPGHEIHMLIRVDEVDPRKRDDQ